MAQPESALLLDWAGTARKLGKVPSVYEYERAGRFSNVPFQTRYRRWKTVPEAFARFAPQDGVDQEWWDVLAIINGKRKPSIAARQRQAITEGHCVARPADLWRPAGAAGAGVRAGETKPEWYLPLHVARKLGFTVHRIQTEFPRLRGHATSCQGAVAAGKD